MPDQSGPPASVGILVPTGMLGGGFSPATITRGLCLGADVIAVDGGSTDSGPYYLGAGVAKTAEEAVRRDLRLLLAAANSARIPPSSSFRPMRHRAVRWPSKYLH